jgi:AcrR family transcriptional regulator
MDEKTDRRIQRTKKLLRNAIIELSLERGYEHLTIEDITDYANLGRTTFYLHYKEKKELLLDSLEVIITDLFREIYSYENLQKWKMQSIDPRKMVFIHAAENADLYRLFFDGEIGGIVITHFRKHLAGIFNQITEALQKKYNLTPHIPNPVSTNFTSGALMGVLSWWLQNNMPYSPEEIYELYHYMVVNGAAKSIGFDELPVQD